jgi:hypothetical protein
MARERNVETQEIIFKNFAGINNVANATNLDIRELQEANNVDIDNEGRITRRNGYTKKYAPSGKSHSLWSNDRICLFVDGTSLMELHTDYSATVLRTNISTLPVEYADANEEVYYTNATVIGYIDKLGVPQLFTDPGIEYKMAPQPGQHIEFYNGRLYIARNHTLWFTDAYALGRVDMRKNAIEFKDEITMVKAVDDGLYVSIGDINDRSSVIFLSGPSPEEMKYIEVAEYGAIEGTAVKPKSAFVGDGTPGKTVMWTSRKGICLGANGGNFKNLTAARYEVTRNRYGAGLYRLNGGTPQYIASLWT